MLRVNLLPPAPLPPSSALNFTSFAQMARAIPNSAAHFAASATRILADYRPRLAPLLFAGGTIAAIADPSLSMSLLCGGLAIAGAYGINLPTGIVSAESYRTLRQGSRDRLLAEIEKGDFTAVAAFTKTMSPNSADVAGRLAELLQEDRPRVLRILGAFTDAARTDPNLLPFVIDFLKSFGEDVPAALIETTVFPSLLSLAATHREALNAVWWLLSTPRDKAVQRALILTHLSELVEFAKNAPIEWAFSQNQLKEELFRCAEADVELKPDIARAFGIDPAELMSEAARADQQQQREHAEFRRWVREEATLESIVERIRQEGRRPEVSDGLSELQTSLAAQRIHNILYAVLEEKGKAHSDLITAPPKSSFYHPAPPDMTIAIANGETMRLLENILEQLIPSAEEDLPSLVMVTIAMAFVSIHTRTTKNLAPLGNKLAIEAEILARGDTFGEVWLQMLREILESYATGGPEALFFESSLRQAPEWVRREA